MADVQLTLLGSPHLAVPDCPDASGQLGAKSLALLAFLSLEPGPHTREELAGLLWSDSPAQAARASLRQALRQLRAVLGDAIRVERQEVSLDAGVLCDAVTFLDTVDTSPEDAARFDVPRFLAGFSIRRASGFDEWSEATRDRLLRTFLGGLRAATRAAMERSHWRAAAQWADRWIGSDPLSDEAVRRSVEAWYMAGDRGEALARYHAYRDRLSEQAGAEPSGELQRLVDRVVAERATDLQRDDLPDLDLPAQGFEPTLIGRESQWRVLTGVWADVTAGHPRGALVEGEPGIGKTRLADEFLRWAAAEGATVLCGRGYDAETGVAYAPVVDGLRGALDAPGLASTAPQWLAELARILPDVRRRFANLPEPSAPGDTDRRWRLFEAVAQAIQGLASERPTVLAIDDLQRCDRDTCALLHFLTERIESGPVLILGTVTLGDVEPVAPAARLCRALRGGKTATTVVTLAPLQEPEVWTIIRELGSISAPDGARRFAAQVHSVTDGNPFHMLELLKALFAQGVLTVDPETGEWVATPAVGTGPYQRIQMPRTVHDAIAERCARLRDELRDLVITIAVAGSGASTHLLSHVHGISRLRAAALADALVERRLVAEEDGRYRCAHPIVQDVVRADLTPARRREVHREIALAFSLLAHEGSIAGAAGEIARHAERGGESALAFGAAIDASDAALAGGAFEDALSWLDLAARVAGSAADAETVNLRTGQVLQVAGWPEPPAARRRAPTPSRGFARHHLDLREGNG